MILYFIFFLSGASTLIFEVCWQKKLYLILGVSPPAMAAIFMGFFLGLGLGSFCLGHVLKSNSSRGNTANFYFFCELGLGITALLTPVLLDFSQELYAWLFQSLPLSTKALFPLKLLFAALPVLPSTFFMGATIPLMAEILKKEGVGGSHIVSRFYGVNTLGAVAGALFAGVILIHIMGLNLTLAYASGMNLIVLILCYFSLIKGRGLLKETAISWPKARISIYRHHWAYFFICSIAGACQIVWMRILSIYNSNNEISFSIGLSTYLLGHGIGSLVFYPYLAKRKDSEQLIRFLYTLFVGILLLQILFIQDGYNQISFFTSHYNIPHWMREIFVSLYLLFAPTLVLGALFPAFCNLLKVENRLSESSSSGALYLFGCLGSFLGIYVVMSWVIGPLQLNECLELALFLLVVGSFFVFHSSKVGVMGAKSGMIVIGLIALLGSRNQIYFVKQIIPGSKIIHYKTGPSATVAVRSIKVEGGQTQILYVDDQPVASSEMTGQTDAKMLAHLPLSLHPSPEKALTIGFGSGGTSYSMILHDVEVDALEIEPEVVKASHLFYGQNRGVLSSPKFNLILEDARNYLTYTKKNYDVISTDATNVHYGQNANLYSVEFYQIVKNRLTPNGIICTWIPLSGLLEDDFKILLRSFKHVFPNGSLWYNAHVATDFALLIGHKGKLIRDSTNFETLTSSSKVGADLALVGIHHILQLKQFEYLDSKEFKEYVGDGPLHTDNNPLLSYLSLGGSRGINHLILTQRLSRIFKIRQQRLQANRQEGTDKKRSRLEKFDLYWAQFNLHKIQNILKYKDKNYYVTGLELIEKSLNHLPDYPQGLFYRRRFKMALNKYLE